MTSSPIASRLLLAAALLAPAAPLAARETAQLGGGPQYTACLNQVKTQPKAALDTALGWLDRGGGAPAQHCAALAQIELGQPQEAASRLERAANEMGAGDQPLRAELLAQAGQAWSLAEQPQRAIRAQSAALTLAPDNVEILIDRALSYAGTGALREATADLDKALSLAPRRADALSLRATAWRLQGNGDRAMEDVQMALAVDPNYPDALLERGIQLKARRQPQQARLDLIKVLRLVPPESGLALRASSELQEIDVRK